jgi:hypothetical protein
LNIYHSNIQKYKASLLELDKDLRGLSAFRLVVFLFSIILIAILANERLIVPTLIILLIFVFGFGLLMRRYNQLAHQKRHNTFLKEINESEVLKLKNKLSCFSTGQAFINSNHAYTSDLDVFGSHSLFQLINRTTTESGSVSLGEWLSEAASKEVILKRQQAIKELKPRLDWRQDFRASGLHFKNPKSEYNKLLAWITTPIELLPHKSKYLIISIFLSIVSTFSIVNYFINGLESDWYIHLTPLILVLFINSRILKKVKPIAEEIIKNTHQNVNVLGGYHSLITKVESEKFDSKILQELQSVLCHENYSAATEIKKLKKILEIFQLRGTKSDFAGGNSFYTVLNKFWIIDIYWILQTEKWKLKNSTYLKSWSSAISEFEVLNSLAGFSYSNPSFAFPKIKEAPYSIHFEMLGHPLINSENRVCNNFNLDGRGEIDMITGSNMAGKSTFLRTIGINLVLAFTGAPCCAKSAEVSSMKIFSSMRTQDNLEEGISSFYAELKRIEQLLKLIQNKEPVFFLLDEMFKGTNSEDRHKGGFSLIKQLEKLNAFGIISTHDLELAKLVEKQDVVTSFSFNSEIKEDDMFFNYELTLGLCKDFNASELMKRSGINILSNISDEPNQKGL